ncbi:GatB/YqeY domain-containing protein [Xylariaceae sp. FL0016]|nr:GatB/YqeY domain-containing protein [Xylariaceae sp. FL0016]
MALRSSSRLPSLLSTRLTPTTSISSPSLLLRPSALQGRLYSDAPAPPLLQKLKADLKTAMRAKDAPRLTAIRSVLAATLNASKTASPVQTDAQLVQLMRRQQRTASESVADFAAAGRDDLVEKENAQIAILEEYAAGSGVQVVGESELRTIVSGVVGAMESEGLVAGKPKMGDLMKKLLAPGGPLEGKNVEKSELAKIVKEITS